MTIQNPKFENWLKDLTKLGPSESSVLIILSSDFKNIEKLEDLMVEVSERIIDTIYKTTYNSNKVKIISDDFDLFFNTSPKKESIILIKNFIQPFNKNKAKYLFDKCKYNIIIFFQQDHLDNFDPDFIEDYCTVVII